MEHMIPIAAIILTIVGGVGGYIVKDLSERVVRLEEFTTKFVHSVATLEQQTLSIDKKIDLLISLGGISIEKETYHRNDRTTG